MLLFVLNLTLQSLFFLVALIFNTFEISIETRSFNLLISLFSSLSISFLYKYNLTIPLLCPTDLGAVYNKIIKLDGKTTQTMRYDNTYHTNKLRLIIKHPASSNHPKFQASVETFI